jgi:class 3 adenylate cyclase
MFTDMVDFSRQMGTDEARMMRLLDVHNRIIQHAVAAHQGQVIKTIGDAFLVDFPSVVQAVRCAQQIQAQFPSRFMSASASTSVTSSSETAMSLAMG